MSSIHMPEWHAGFLQVLSAVETHAKIQFRHLPREKREDAIQEAIASACVSYQILAAKGRLHDAKPAMIANFAVNYVKNHRHVGGHQNVRDVMSSLCQHRHGAKVISDADGWELIAVEDHKANIPDLAAFRIDFAHWLHSHTHRNRRIINRLAAGEKTMEVAERFGISEGRVSQLRRRFERDWQVFQGEDAAA